MVRMQVPVDGPGLFFALRRDLTEMAGPIKDCYEPKWVKTVPIWVPFGTICCIDMVKKLLNYISGIAHIG